MKDKLIRYYRILKHLIIYIKTSDIGHKYEVQHYYYMKQFKQIT